MANVPGGVTASDSLLLDNDLSWKHIVHALKPAKGGVRWALLLAIAGNFVASIFLNPLSAGLLQVIDVRTTSLQQFSTFDVSSQTINSTIGNSVYARSTANFLYNLNTSVWTGPDFVAMPFWPRDEIPNLGRTVLPSTQSWNGSTEVFRLLFLCQDVTNMTGWYTDPEISTELRMNSTLIDGCSLTNTVPTVGGGYWGNFTVRPNFPELLRSLTHF
jgi:hypothetical protein